MKTAVIGYGTVGRLHASILDSRGELLAICDNAPAALAAASAAYPNAPCFANYHELLERFHPDAVHICTPHYLHAEMVTEALRRNIHVLCEKPLCIREDEISAILAAERASRATLGVCLQNRYNAANRYAQSYLQKAQTVSGVGQVAWRRTAEYYASGAWRGKWATEGGGVLINQALHTLDLLQWMLGMPDRITAMVSELALGNAIEVEDTAVLSCEGKNGFLLFATNAAPADMPVSLQFRADGKAVTVLPHRVCIDKETISFAEPPPTYIAKQCYGSGHELLIDDFYARIARGEHFPIDGAEGAKVIRLILAAYKSHGVPIAVTDTEGKTE